MVYKCENCGRALEYNPELRLFECRGCESLFSIEQVSVEEQRKEEKYSESRDMTTIPAEEDANVSPEDETMECDICACSSCGAELFVSRVEAATFCPYCGQPSIVFERISKQMKPKYIIPFCVSKEQVVDAVRDTFKERFLISKSVCDFKVENIKGVYLPFWVFDVFTTTSVIFDEDDGNNYLNHHFVKGEALLRGICSSASNQVSDDYTQMLMPYDVRCLKEFDAAYLSGYYADIYNVNIDMALKRAINFSKALCTEALIEKVLQDNGIKREGKSFNLERKIKKEFEHKEIVHDCCFEHDVRSREYALLPVWFLSFQYKKKPHTILVNGQTGKIVGTLPVDKLRFALLLLALWIVFTGIILGVLFLIDMLFISRAYIGASIFGITFVVVSFVFFVRSFKPLRTHNKKLKKTNNSLIFEYSKSKGERG